MRRVVPLAVVSVLALVGACTGSARHGQRLDLDGRRRLTIGHDHAHDGYRCRNADA